MDTGAALEPVEVEREGRKRAHLFIAAGAAVLVTAVAIGGFLVASDGPESAPEEVVAVAESAATAAEEATTTTLDMPPPRGSVPDASLEGHPQEEWYTEDPEGQALAEAFRRQRETGWVIVQLSPEREGFVTLECWQASRNGSVMEVAGGDGELIGYQISAVGFVDVETFQSEDFDWRALARENFPRQEYPVDVAQQRIDSIEQQGGLSEVCRIDT